MKTTISSLLVLFLKDIRFQRKLTTQEVSRLLNKDDNFWKNIEDGNTRLSIDVLFSTCKILETNLSLLPIDPCISQLISKDCLIETDLSLEQDDLFKLMNQFYSLSKTEFFSSFIDPSVPTPIAIRYPNISRIITFLNYCTDEEYRQTLDKQYKEIKQNHYH